MVSTTSEDFVKYCHVVAGSISILAKTAKDLQQLSGDYMETKIPALIYRFLLKVTKCNFPF